MKTKHCVTLLAMLLVDPASVQAQRLITTDTTQDGGTFVVSPRGTLTVSDAANDPLLTLTGGASTSGVRQLIVGDQSGEQGRLLVKEGSTLINTWYSFLGLNSGSTGTATITGAGSQWQNSDNMFVGNSGSGTLNIEDGGLVTNTDAKLGSSAGTDSQGMRIQGIGKAIITGEGSKWQNRGNLQIYGPSTLNVTNGGEVTVDSTLTTSMNSLSGDGKIATYNAFLDDANLKFDSGSQQAQAFGNGGQLYLGTGNSGPGDLGIGYSATSTLSISNGAMLRSSNGYLGLRNGSTGIATVTGAESEWKNSTNLYVGNGGTGTLTVEKGGIVRSFFGYVGNSDNGNGEATVTGPGSLWDSSRILYVGNSGSGKLTIEDGGVVNSYGGFVGYGNTGTVTVTGTGSEWQNSYSGLNIGQYGVGRLIIEDGGVVTNGGAQLGYRGEATAVVTGTGSKWINNGSLYINTSGTLTVSNGGQVIIGGDLTHNNGLIKLELSGSSLLNPIQIGKEFDLWGVIEIDLIEGFNPTAHSIFNLFDFGSLVDHGHSFDFTHATLREGLSWDTSTFAVDGTIRVVPETGSLLLAGIGLLAGLACWWSRSRST